MRQLLLAGTASLALVALQSPAHANPIVFDFTYTGSLVNFTVPTTDTYQILAFGAQGGNGFSALAPGGRGAEIGGDLSLTAGEILQIAVGGLGSGGGGSGGGGGSFVVGPGNTPLLIAGGGGGATPFPTPGQGGLTGPDGGGTGGKGGAAGGGAGGGGSGGFFTAGGTDGGFGGGAFPGLAGGDFGGGFGGGGGQGRGAGGGGGYSGGGPGSSGGSGAGGGGGSFDAGTDQILMADFQTGNGEVIITELAAAVPEPASIALLAVSVPGLAVVRRRRRPD